MIAGLCALYFQGSKESDEDMAVSTRELLWYLFASSSIAAALVLAVKLPLKKIVAERRKKLSITGRTARERGFDVGPEKNAGNSSLPKALGIEVSPFDREVSVQRREHNQILGMESKKLLKKMQGEDSPRSGSRSRGANGGESPLLD